MSAAALLAAARAGLRRLTPAETPDPAFAGARRVIVLCNGGYASSLAAARLQAMGVPEATDVIGGYEAWVAEGLPHTTAPTDVGGA